MPDEYLELRGGRVLERALRDDADGVEQMRREFTNHLMALAANVLAELAQNA